MSTFLVINFIVTGLLLSLFVIGHYTKEDLKVFACLFFVGQCIFFYGVLGLGAPVGDQRVTAIPASEFEIVRTANKVLLMLEPSPVVFTDAQTFLKEEFKEIEKVEFLNAYGSPVGAVKYSLK